MSRVSFNVAAKCDKAGRTQNQDNYWVCPDLSRINDSFEDVIGKDKDVTLSDKGALLVVADGMGGMNAGEKASELVVKGVQKGFSNIPESILGNDDQMLSFIRDVIVSSDQSVKDYAKVNREADGLGSTIVLLWLWEGKAYCGWCGDSRIYRYNPNNSLARLSHDHSYVQELVDDGKIEPEEAFDHPDGNIVTRALGDNGEKANPELKVYDICERDMFLLCSDGLCGLLQDKQIEDIISVNCSSTKDALAALWKAGESEGWTDNATIDLLNIVEGGARPKGVAVGYPVIKRNTPSVPRHKDDPKVDSPSSNLFKKISPKIILFVVASIAIILLTIVLIRTLSKGKNEMQQQGGNTYEVTVTDYQNDNSTSGNATNDNLNSNNQGGSNQGGRIGGRNGNSGSHQGNSSASNNNSNSNNGNSSNSNPNNGVSNSDIGNAISNNEPITTNNNSGSHQGTSQIENSHTVSSEYKKMLKNVIDDYSSILNLWRTVINSRKVYDEEEDRLNEFVRNVKQLIDNPDYDYLDARDKQIIDQRLRPLKNDIEKNIEKYKK